MIPPESSGASRTKVAWCNRGGLALESACRATVRAISAKRTRRVVKPCRRPGGPPRVRCAHRPADWSRLPARPTPSGHVPSSGPLPTDDPRPLEAPHAARPDHSPSPRSHELPLAAPPHDSSCDLGETHAARRATSYAGPGGPPRVRRAPSPPPIGHDSPPAPPRAVTSRRPDPGQPTPCDHSRPDRQHVLTTHGPPRSQQPPLAAPPHDSPCDLGETHAARRATGAIPRTRQLPREER